MRYDEMAYPSSAQAVAAQAAASERAAFIRRTYAHLAGAILAFIGVEFVLFAVLGQEGQNQVLRILLSNRLTWLLVLGAFIGGGVVAQMWAQSDTSPAVQYAGLGLYVLLEAIIFLPLLIIAARFTDATVIPTAGILTLAVFGGLTLSVFVTKKDYSFLRPILCLGTMLALGVIVAAIFFPFPLGLFFSFAMVALMCAFILYDTSNVLHHYRTDQHVAASLALFASIATLFWYILQIVMSLSGRD
jgi:FtsH-binding integral membrane protein